MTYHRRTVGSIIMIKIYVRSSSPLSAKTAKCDDSLMTYHRRTVGSIMIKNIEFPENVVK